MSIIRTINKLIKPKLQTADTDTFLIIFSGESNSGGAAFNDSATVEELAVRPAVKIMNNYTFLFESLHIGFNNLMDHYGFSDNASHGWELGLANETEAGSYAPKTQVHLVKTGQGASKISEWNIGGTWMTKFIDRVSAAQSILNTEGKTFIPIIWYSQGINDALASTNVTTWKNATISHFADLRNIIGYNTYILMTKLMSPDYDTYNTAIDEIAALDPLTIAIDTSGTTLLNPNHWDYAGMKIIAQRMTQQTMSVL